MSKRFGNAALYPMGDRGGTATDRLTTLTSAHYTRWEIGGEPQQRIELTTFDHHYTRWEIGGEPQQKTSLTRMIYDYTRWEIGGEPQRHRRPQAGPDELYPMGDRGGTATPMTRTPATHILYPMGDRGGTATSTGLECKLVNYTRWEIGGEPQLYGIHVPTRKNYTRWEIGGEPQPMCSLPKRGKLYPMGDRGGTATAVIIHTPAVVLYPMGDRGGTATGEQYCRHVCELYPMGDRGGTATRTHCWQYWYYYTRWEIGGEPQQGASWSLTTMHYTRWEIGGEPQHPQCDWIHTGDYTRWEIGGEPQLPLAHSGLNSIIPDGRSGGNRNSRARIPPAC